MATREPSRGEPRSASRSVALDGLASVIRAARIKPAIGTEQGTDRVLVGAKHTEERGFHHRDPEASRCTLSSSRRPSSAAAATSAGRQAQRKRSTTSNAFIAGRRARIASRNMRLSRFLSMARLRSLLPITYPTRPVGPAAGTTMSCSRSPSNRLPRLKTAANCATPRNR
jgi:hypothetical protein